MNNEKANLINNYLIDNPCIVHCGKSNDMIKVIFELLHHLEQFECPDMYAKKDNKVLILEHFEFDGSVEKSGKGMEGIREENIATSFFYEQRNIRNEGITYGFNYPQTTENYLENFQKHFLEHYSKINNYKENLKQKQIIDDKIELLIGFFIENKVPPIFFDINNQIEEVCLDCTKQFLDIYENSIEIDFVLFGGLFGGKNRLSYIDKSLISEARKIQIDLEKIDFIKMAECEWRYNF